MSWKKWSLREWNEALVGAVFLAPERAQITVSRIDASGRFLAKCTKDKDSDPEDAKKYFINAFGNTVASVRSNFRWTDAISATPNTDEAPSCFAALYLTLLAASADNETAGVGDFRARFSEIVKATNGQSVDFRSLPRMWLAVQAWAVSRSNHLGDCALLALPDPKNEKQIGYSKRIAFPAYRDEIFLRKTLRKFKLSEISSFEEVAYAVASEMKGAITLANFREEFWEFQRLVRHAESQQAYESPFWGAVRDICLEEAHELARTKGVACLALDIADPNEPQFNFYLDEIAAKKFQIPTKELHFVRRDGCKYIAFENGRLPSANSLQFWASKRKNLAESKIGKGLAEGWLIFLPDQLGDLTSEGSFYEGGPICLLAKNSEISPLIALNKHLGVKAIPLDAQGALNGWQGMCIPSAGEKYRMLLMSYVPASVQAMLRTGWTPPRPRLSGGARYGQILLLNPASNPTVRMQDATKGSYRLLGANSEEIRRGNLEVYDDEGFQIPSADLVDVPVSVRACEFILETAVGKSASTKVWVATESPEGPSAQVRVRSQWLVDGSTGVLSRADVEKGAGGKESPPSAQYVLPSVLFPPLLKLAPNSHSYESKSLNINDINPAFNWVTDALTLRFNRRSSLTFDLLDEHVSGAATVAGLGIRAFRQLLFYGRWLLVQTQRDAPYSSVARADIEMSVASRNGELFARIAGMLSRQAIARLENLLRPGETCSRIGTDQILSLGCIEIKVPTQERAAELAQEIGAQLVLPGIETRPLAALSPSSSEMHVLDQAVALQQVERWSWGWSPVIEAQGLWPLGELRRAIYGKRAWYWVKLAEKIFVKTDSAPWAWIVSSIARGEDVAVKSPQGSIVWSKSIVELPASLTRWWMLFGGGCIAMDGDGRAIFTGHDYPQVIEAMGWKSERTREAIDSIALDRRKLALRLRNSRRINQTK